MKTKTSLLGLEKHDEEEFYDVNLHSNNAEIIDLSFQNMNGEVDQLKESQGDLGALQTTEKSSLVGAMNEVFQNAILNNLTTLRFNKDDNDIFTEIQFKREDETLFKKSVLSGGISPQYTTRTVTYYDEDGITEASITIYTLNYTGDDLTSEVIVDE